MNNGEYSPIRSIVIRIPRTRYQSGLLQSRRYVAGIIAGVAQPSDTASGYHRSTPDPVLISGWLGSGHTREIGLLPAAYWPDIIDRCFVPTTMLKCAR